MVETVGRRERKKQQTRRALTEAAMTLFARNGFEQTLVTEIAEAADVSERTFYLHFPTKEDIVVGDAEQRLEAGLHAIANWQAGQTVAQALERAASLIIDATWRSDLPSGLAALRVRLLASTPSVQSRLVGRLLQTQTSLIDALLRAAPETLTRPEAAALVGAAIGALNSTAIVCIEDGLEPDEVRQALNEAVTIALRPETVSGRTRPKTS